MAPRKINDQELIRLIDEEHLEQKAAAARLGVSPASVCQRLALLRKRAACNAILEPLTDKQAQFVTAIVSGASQTEAARQAYDCTDKSASALGSELMKTESVSEAISEILSLAGVTRHSLAKTLRRHIDSKADPGVSLKAVGMGFKLFNDFPALVTKNLNLNVQICPVDLSKYQ